MSETFQIGDNVVIKNAAGVLQTQFGMDSVTASDISHVTVGTYKFNAGTLKMLGAEDRFLARPTEADIAELMKAAGAQKRAALADAVETYLRTKVHTESTLEAALSILKGETRTCRHCFWWRPPFDDYGPGNCHSIAVRMLTTRGEESYPPPTLADFGCVHWTAKQLPENGDDSDE